jgi:hypothetical protein
MKLSVIMPVIDYPKGSGRCHPFFKSAIRSALDGGIDVEVLVGSDGPLPCAREAVEEISDRRVIFNEYQRTLGWGNYQRHEMIRNVASGTHVAILDYDDAYLPGALKELDREVSEFPRHVMCFVTLMQPATLAGVPHFRALQVDPKALVVPRVPGMPDYGTSPAPDEDGKWFRRVYEWSREGGPPWMQVPTELVQVRPWQEPEIL